MLALLLASAWAGAVVNVDVVERNAKGVQAWRIEQLYDAGWIKKVDIETTSDGRPVILASQDYTSDGRWETNVWLWTMQMPGVWLQESVGARNLYSSLALDSHDTPHVAMTQNVADHVNNRWDIGLYYTTRDGQGGWPETFIALAEEAVIRVDNNDRPHIIYIDPPSLALVDATLRDGEWVKTVVLESPAPWDSWVRFDFRFGQDGKLHLITKAANGMNYLRLTPDLQPVLHEVFLPGNRGFVHLALDSQDEPTISYEIGWNLATAKRDATGWHETVHPFTAAGNDIIIDSHDRPHIAYRANQPLSTNPLSNHLQYATQNESGDWHYQPLFVDPDGQAWRPTVDPYDNPHIGYVMGRSVVGPQRYDDVRYATLATTAISPLAALLADLP